MGKDGRVFGRGIISLYHLTGLNRPFLLFTAGVLSAGVGLLYRKPWGRILTLLLAGLICLFGLFLTAIGFIAIMNSSPTEMTPQILFGLGLQLYPLLVFSTLIQGKYAAEFKSTSPETTEGPHE